MDSFVLSSFAPLLRYPGKDHPRRVAELRSQLERECPRALAPVDAFVAATSGWSMHRHEEVFTRTFDLEPQCSPYLGVHLFGEHNALRSQLLTGLAVSFARDPLDDLPDHVAEILEHWSCLSEAEQRELRDMCVLKALSSMIGQLRLCSNPYQHLLEAVQCAFEPARAAVQPEEVARA